MKNKNRILSFLCLLAIMISIIPVSAETIEHTHIWATTYDSTNHWEYCTICNEIQNKVEHTLVGNGGSKTLCDNGYYNNAYRDICSCGYQSLPQVVIHGRYENFAESKRLNYGSMTNYYLSSVKQITYEEFLSISYPAAPGGQEYTWTDHDGDGYGWVFCGGPILSTYGATSTLQLILGKDNIKDFGRGVEFDEVFKLCRYIYSDSTPTLTEFVNSLPAKSEIDTDHLLYGMKEKYQNVTEAQWTEIVKNFKGYYTHSSSWGWTSMNIQHSGHPNSGATLYSNSACYDSTNNHNVSFSDGIKTDCDLCGAHYTGNENYTANTWYRCSYAIKLKEGETKTCTGHVVTGIGNAKLGTCYCTFTKINGTVYRTKVEAVPADGYTYTSTCTENFQVPKSSLYTTTAYGYYGTVRFYNDTTGRTISCGITHPLTDEEAPVISNVEQNPQNYVNEWATINEITITGTEDISETIYITVKNKAENKVILNKEAIKVSDGSFTYVATPALEGTSEGVVYTVIATDLRNNTSTYDFVVYKTDASAPEITSELIYKDWSPSKTVTLNFTDYGSKGVQFSFNNQDDYKELSGTENTYTWTKTFETEQSGTTDYKIYVKDGLGNATVYTLTVGNIDNTDPIISGTSITKNSGSTSVTVTASDNLSGIAGYAIVKSGGTPTYQTSNKLSVTETGTYDVYVKDKAGNTSMQSIDVSVNYKNVIKHIATGLNENMLLQTTYFEMPHLTKFTPDTGYGLTIPNGYYLDLTYKCDYNGSLSSYTFGTTFTQPSKVINYEFYYRPYEYTISYNLDGGTNGDNPESYTVVNGVTLKNPSKTGYTFTGWTDQNGNKVTGINQNCSSTFSDVYEFYNELSTRQTGNIELTANWKINEYTVSTNSNTGGIISNKSIATYNSATSIFIIPMDGYEIEDVVVDGTSQGVITTYDFWDINSDHTVIATFKRTDDLNSYLNELQAKYSWINIQ